MSWEKRIGRKINLRDLHILLRVAHTGSLAKAATELSLPQPACSRAIPALERISPDCPSTTLITWPSVMVSGALASL